MGIPARFIGESLPNFEFLLESNEDAIKGIHSGIGFEVTIGLVKKDFEVIMACRNIQKAEDAKNKILRIHPKAKINIIKVDTSSLKEVRKFVDEFLKKYKNFQGFFINGYSSNHYPDFIIYTNKNNLILLETKGDHLINEDTKEKNKLGKLWIDKAGSNYKFFMVFEKANVEGCYNEGNILEVLKRL